MARYSLLGINVDLLSEEEIFNQVRELSKTDKSQQIILLDSYMLMKAKFDKNLANIINSAALVIPISKGIVSGLKFVCGVKGEYHYHYNLIIRLLTFLTDFNENIYILGGKKEAVIRRVESRIKSSFPGIRLMGTYHFGYKKSFEKDLLTAMKKSAPALILVSNSRPKQELWIAKNKKFFPKGVFIGVENFVNIIGSKDKKADYDNERKKIPVIGKNWFRIIYFIDYGFALFFSKLFGSKNAKQPKPTEPVNDTGNNANYETDVFGDRVTPQIPADDEDCDTIVKQ